MDAELTETEAGTHSKATGLLLRGIHDVLLRYSGLQKRWPSFVADAYALRLAARWGLIRPTAQYEEVRALFMDNLPSNAVLFNEYHALIVIHGKEICRPKPLCEACPLNRSIRVDTPAGRA